MEAKIYLSVSEFVQRTGLPAGWLLRELRAGRLPAIKAGKRWRIPVEQAEKALAQRASKADSQGVRRD